MNSVWLSRSGAVVENEGDTVAWHYGDPLREQRHLATTGAVVDRGDRGILAVTGPERLTWLHSLTSQHLTALATGQGTELLILSPNGHIEHHAMVFDDGTTTWLDTEPGASGALSDFLLKMRFFTQVEIEDLSADWTLLTVTGPTAIAAPDALPVPEAKFSTGTLAARPSVIYSGEVSDTGGFTRRTDVLGVPTVDMMVQRKNMDSVAGDLGLPVSGTWSFGALRIPALRPKVGIDTDHKTIPHELPGLLAAAVHLDKGCYRGQETVARVHHLGKPPRRLAMLHLDGSDEHPPAPDTEVTSGGRTVGRIGTAARHYEDGMIALALVRRNVTEKPGVELDVAGSAAVL